MAKDAEENPSLRQRFGERVAAKIRQQAKERRQEATFREATRRFRPRKAERGGIVLLAATKTRVAKVGERVQPSYRGKVFALYVTRTGKLRPYKEKVYGPSGRAKAKHKFPVPLGTRTLDPQQFPSPRARRIATEVLVPKGDRLVAPVRVESRRGNVGWHETVVPLAAKAMEDTAMKATGGKGVGNLPMMVDVRLELALPDGSRKVVTVTDDFGQRREQGERGTDFYTPYFQKKVYALVGESLMAMGLVSQGSASRVAKANVGKPRSKWKWRGGPWHKRNLPVARVAAVEIQPRLIRVERRVK